METRTPDSEVPARPSRKEGGRSGGSTLMLTLVVLVVLVGCARLSLEVWVRLQVNAQRLPGAGPSLIFFVDRQGIEGWWMPPSAVRAWPGPGRQRVYDRGTGEFRGWANVSRWGQEGDRITAPGPSASARQREEYYRALLICSINIDRLYSLNREDFGPPLTPENSPAAVELKWRHAAADALYAGWQIPFRVLEVLGVLLLTAIITLAHRRRKRSNSGESTVTSHGDNDE